ncbi:hypothetical protein INR49_011603 [Caranx melampygus]|nr:hypothetical protein INR49_011603 [Caranx melampygus]
MVEASGSDRPRPSCFTLTHSNLCILSPPTVQIVHSGQACNVEEGYSERVYTIREGETLELQCLVTGHPRPQIRWTKTAGGASDRQGDTSLHNDTLRIESISRHQGGRYYCKAENRLGIPAIRSIRVDNQTNQKIRESFTLETQQKEKHLEPTSDLQDLKEAPQELLLVVVELSPSCVSAGSDLISDLSHQSRCLSLVVENPAERSHLCSVSSKDKTTVAADQGTGRIISWSLNTTVTCSVTPSA